MRFFLCTVFLIFLLQNSAFAEDKVVLKDGTVLHGEIKENDDNKTSIQMDVFYASQIVPRNEIVSIEKNIPTAPSPRSESQQKTYNASSQGAASSPPLPEITPEQARKLLEQHSKQNSSK